MRSVWITLLFFAVWISMERPALGAGHGEITVIPLGQHELKGGVNERIFSLPAGSVGLFGQPVVLIASRPAGAAGQESVTLKISVGQRRLPDWELQAWATAFVINLDTIRQNQAYRVGRLALKIELAGRAETIKISALGMPDPLLLKNGEETALDGPLALFEASALDPDVKAYFSTLRKEIAGEKELARSGYESLKAAGHVRVARFARRGLRILSYDLRKRKVSGNFMESYRWGLYLQFCGLFSAAFQEFEECRIIDPSHGDSQFRAGECLEQIGGGLIDVLYYMDRTGGASVRAPTYWHTLVVIQRSRNNRSLTDSEVIQIKNNWLIAEKMAWAASGGALQTATSFYEVADSMQQAYASYPGEITAPSEDIVETRGWFDSVISVRPRLEGEERAQVRIAGGGAGPNGAAIAALGHDAAWPQYLKALYGHLLWAAEISEGGPGLPGTEDAVDCGLQPTRHEGQAYRAALRYHYDLDTIRGLNIADVPAPGTFVRMWMVEGPFKVNDQLAAGGKPRRHVMDPIPAGTPETVVHLLSEADFIDLAKWIPNAGWALARATSWVFSPHEQTVRLNLGRNDGIAVWVNGQTVLSGQHYASGSFEDKNLVNTLSRAVKLEKGWNELKCVVEAWPGKWSRGWGFSVGIVSKTGTPVPGLAYSFKRPEKDVAPAWQRPIAGNHYSWSKVKDDFRRLLPRLTEADLRNITGVGDLHLVSEARPWEGCVAVVSPSQSPSSTYRKPPEPWKAGRDRDVVLNNLMDWARESCAAFRYRKGGNHRDLLFLKPEAVEAFLLLLDEPDSGGAMFDGRPVHERVLGYCVVSLGGRARTLLVVDARLSDAQNWPIDEEDLLTPFGEYIPNSTRAVKGPPESSVSAATASP